MGKTVTAKEAAAIIQSGMTVMVGGFQGCGCPDQILACLSVRPAVDLCLITNDTCYENQGVGRLISRHQVKKVMTSHIGLNRETGRQMNSGELEVTLIPQGTLAEAIRAGGAGLGGVLTPVGVGTKVEEGKRKLQINGREYLLELPIKADVSLVYAAAADEKGNLCMKKTAKNFNPIMAMAGKIVIAEAGRIVKIGELDPDAICIPGEVVDYIVERGEQTNAGDWDG